MGRRPDGNNLIRCSRCRKSKGTLNYKELPDRTYRTYCIECETDIARERRAERYLGTQAGLLNVELRRELMEGLEKFDTELRYHARETTRLRGERDEFIKQFKEDNKILPDNATEIVKDAYNEGLKYGQDKSGRHISDYTTDLERESWIEGFDKATPN